MQPSTQSTGVETVRDAPSSPSSLSTRTRSSCPEVRRSATSTRGRSRPSSRGLTPATSTSTRDAGVGTPAAEAGSTSRSANPAIRAALVSA